MEKLHLEPLENAIRQLALAIDRAKGAPGDEVIRDGTIQRFEYTMDLCWKLIQRWLKDIAQLDELAIRTKKDLFREAAARGLVKSAEDWIGHYNARNETSHSYNAKTAEAVFARAIQFHPHARDLLSALRDAV